MENNTGIPDTWGIPDDQANKVREALSKKSIRPEDAVQNALEEIARDIAIIESDPVDWGWWVGYLLEQLEIHAEKHRRVYNYEQVLVVLVEKVQNRIKGGKW
jgi:hypothetical protein